MGISGTWVVNALTVRVMNTGCDRHLIALVSLKISTMDLSLGKSPDIRKRGVYFRKEQINRNNTASVEQTARLKDRKIVHWTVNTRTWKNTVLSFVEPRDSRDFP